MILGYGNDSFLKTKWVKIGFAVEDGDRVEDILKSINLG
jgi:hypothetical protein